MSSLGLPQRILLEWINYCRLFIVEIVPLPFRQIQVEKLYIEMAKSSYILYEMFLNDSKFPYKSKRIYHHFTRNPCISLQFIEDQADFPWDWYAVLSTRKLSVEKLMDMMKFVGGDDQGNMKYVAVSRNLYLTLDAIRKYPSDQWDWSAVSRNPNITVRDIRAHTDLPWNYFCLSQSANIDMQLILDFPDKPWDWPSLSHNPAITMKDIRAYPNLPWNYALVATHELLTMSDVLSLFASNNRRSTWFSISCNPGITLVEILAHPELPWQWQFVSKNPNLTLDVVLAYPDKDWSWRFISEHANITAEDLLNHPELPWVWRYASYNPNVTMEVVRRYHDKPWAWDWDWGESEEETMTFELESSEGVKHALYFGDWYVQRMCAIYSVLNMHEEDYERGASCLDYENAVDVVLQNECYIHEIVEYI